MTYHENAVNPISEEEFALIKDFRKCIFCTPPDKKILIETKNFYVTFDACALTDGHVEIHTKSHIGCAGEIFPEDIEEYVELKSRVAKLIKDIYGVAGFYEHGRAGHCSIVKDDINCHHFHIHVLPMDVDVAEDIAKEENVYAPIKMNSDQEILDLYQRYDQYLYFENAQGEKYFFPVVGEIPSHYLRTIFANALGHPERADWENYFDLHSINRFKEKIQQGV